MQRLIMQVVVERSSLCPQKPFPSALAGSGGSIMKDLLLVGLSPVELSHDATSMDAQQLLDEQSLDRAPTRRLGRATAARGRALRTIDLPEEDPLAGARRIRRGDERLRRVDRED